MCQPGEGLSLGVSETQTRGVEMSDSNDCGQSARCACQPVQLAGPMSALNSLLSDPLFVKLLLLTLPLAPAWSQQAFGDEPAAALADAAAMAASREDVWGEAAIAAPGGPSYEFFRDLLPPLRYANTAFRHYPIVLSAPAAPHKVRWISNGGAVNARANKPPMWREVGVPVQFFVGDDRSPYGADIERLEGPKYADGWLPIVEIAYRHGRARYGQQAFAPVDPPLADRGAALVRFTVRDAPGAVAARVEAEGDLRHAAGVVTDGEGRAILAADSHWSWDPAARELRAKLADGESAVLAIYSRLAAEAAPALTAETYDRQRALCSGRWQELLDGGARFDAPEPIVQNAWRSLVVGQWMIAVGDRMHYSAGNAYDHLYESECGDAVRSLWHYGHVETARRMISPLMAFNRQATRFHVAGHKLALLADYYWISRDAEFFRQHADEWRGAVEFIRSSRQEPSGLLPADNYAGDIKRQVISLSSNAACWRGLRDMAAVLSEIGAAETAAQLRREAEAFRQAIVDAAARSERHETEPPFIPLALLAGEAPFDPLTATRLGSYYDLMAPYVIGSGVFGPGSQRETWLIDYLRRHGGLAMGMIRSTPHQGEFDGQPGVNVLYGLRYMQALLRRDDRRHALAGFYGQLAQGMTRDTYIGGEGSRFLHGDRFGRSFYLPPNSAANAMFLETLRYLLVQDWDLDDDGRPETLHLLFAAPGRWLADGRRLSVERAPSAFGEISLRVESHLNQGEALVSLEPLARRPERCLLRLPLPDGWRVVRATDAAKKAFPLAADGAVELTAFDREQTIRFAVEHD